MPLLLKRPNNRGGWAYAIVQGEAVTIGEGFAQGWLSVHVISPELAAKPLDQAVAEFERQQMRAKGEGGAPEAQAAE